MADINYSKIVHRSWELTKKNKWLWLYGSILAMFGAGGSNRFNPGNPNIWSSKGSSTHKATEEATKVLGATTSQLTDWLHTIPASTWLLLLLGFVFFLIIGLIISWVVRSWAQAALLSALFEAETKDITSLSSSSKIGLSKIKSFILFSLISFGIGFLFIATTFSIAGIGVLVFSFSAVLRNIWLFICIFAGSLTFIFGIMLFIMTEAYAQRLMILKNLAPWAAWKSAFKLSKKHFLSGFLMGIINTGIGCGVGCVGMILTGVLIGIPAILVLIPTIMASSAAKSLILPNIFQIVGLILLAFMFIYLQYLISGIFLVFKAGTWNLLIKELLKEEKTP